MSSLIAVPARLPVRTFVCGRDPLPVPSAWARLLFRALGAPLLNRGGLLDRMLCRELGLPRTTRFAAGFVSRGGQLHCGRHVSLSDTVFFDYAPVFLDDYVCFSFRNLVLTSTHDLQDFRRVLARPVVLERNVWVTVNVTILGGVRIGENSVIAAGSVVTRDIPANVLAAGNPCRPIRSIERDCRWAEAGPAG